MAKKSRIVKRVKKSTKLTEPRLLTSFEAACVDKGIGWGVCLPIQDIQGVSTSVGLLHGRPVVLRIGVDGNIPQRRRVTVSVECLD